MHCGVVAVDHLPAQLEAREPEGLDEHRQPLTDLLESLRRLRFLDSDTLRHLKSVEDTPVLKRNFESSIPGLFMVGLTSANSFGPLARFAYGAGFTARRLSRALA